MTSVGRPADYEQRIIDNVNNVVRDTDTLYHLGDVIFGKTANLANIMSKFRCRVILIRGNHDYKSRSFYERSGFYYVADSITIRHILLSHEPKNPLPDGIKVNVHGHFHTCQHRTLPDWYDPSVYKLVSMELDNYTPRRLDEFYL